ncbi:addiction module antidote protein [uncultured Methylobacterium sp.]|jgi:probable addiction module antidote protein|uniref:addiction module antidote protein n=1 Tax=uncultured Methylobacterium sp. TaxID=157278 RepID=UPI0026151767|nr:addiction module antidote protein [uncultured Methylobacterium sp.]
MALETFPFDPAEHLRTDEDIALYLEAVLDDGDPAMIRDAIGIVARARGMTQIAREAGLGRESLYKALSDKGNPSFETIRAVLRALGLTLTVKRADEAPAART